MTDMQPLAPYPGEPAGDYMDRLFTATLSCAADPCEWGFTGLEADAHAMARTHANMPGCAGHIFMFKTVACICGWQSGRLGGRVELGRAVHEHVRTHIPEAQQ